MIAIATALAATALAAAAQGQAPERIRSLTLQPGETCPPSTAAEVVVCGAADDPYRIPKPLRRDGEVPAAGQSWVNRAAVIDEVGRVAGGLPGTCSVVGTGGQTGCLAQSLRRWAAERREARRAAAAIP